MGSVMAVNYQTVGSVHIALICHVLVGQEKRKKLVSIANVSIL